MNFVDFAFFEAFGMRLEQFSRAHPILISKVEKMEKNRIVSCYGTGWGDSDQHERKCEEGNGYQ